MADDPVTNQENIGLDDNRSIFEVWKKLKNSIFDVLFVLLDNSEGDQTMIGLCLQTGIDYLQMMVFPFESVVIQSWSSGETIDSITNIVDAINVSTYIPGIQFDTFLILLYALIFLIITVILDIIYVAYSFSKKKFKFTWPLVYLAKIVPLIVTVMFLPIMETLLEVVNCTEPADGGDYQVMSIFPDIKCWQGWHLVHSGITMIFSSIFVFVSCIVTLTVFEPRMTTNRLTSRQNSSGQVIFIINKIICQFVFSFSPFSSSLPYSVLLFVLSAWLYSAYNLKQPYYSKKANKFFRIISTYYFWTNFMLLVSQILKPLGFQHGLVVWLCGIAFLGIAIVFERKSNIDTLFSSSLKFKSGEQLQAHLQYVLQLHHNRNIDNNSYMLLLGYIEKHIQICLQDDCPLRIKPPNQNYTAKQEQEYSCQMLLKQIQKMFLFGVKKYPNCTKLRLTFAFFYMQKFNKKPKAFEQFTKAISTDPSLGQQFIIYRFRKIITEKLQENQQQNQTDLIDLIRFDNYISLCEEGMVISGKLHKQFWIQLMEQSPNLVRLNLIGGKITQTYNVIDKNYEQVFKITSDHTFLCQLQYNYSLYLLFVIQNVKLGKMTLKNAQKNYRLKKFKLAQLQSLQVAKKTKQIKQEDSNLNENSAQQNDQNQNTQKCIMIVKISSESNYVSKIVKCNKRFQQLVKYEDIALTNFKLEKILPKVLINTHDRLMYQWMINKQENKNMSKNKKKAKTKKRLQKQYLNQKRTGYLRDSSDCLIKVEYVVKYSSLDNFFVAEFIPVFNSARSCYFISNIYGQVIDKDYQSYCYFSNFLKDNQLQSIFPLEIYTKLTANLSNNAKFSINFANFSNKIRDCSCAIEYIVITNQIKNNSQQQKNLLDDSSIYQQSNKKRLEKIDVSDQHQLVGIVINISPSVYQFNMGKTLHNEKNRKNSSNQTNNLIKISEIIKKLHKAEGRRFRSIYQDPSNIIAASNRVILSKHNYAQYQDSTGKICEIKGYRYFDNKFKRIYFDDLLQEQSDFDYQEKMTDIQAKLSRQKIANQQYQQRISKAINTYIYHPQICHLFYAGFAFIMFFVVANITCYNWFVQQVAEISTLDMQKSHQNFESTYLVSRRLLQILFYEGNDSQVLQSQLNLQNQTLLYHYFIENIIVKDFQLQDGVLIDKNIQNSLYRIQGNILRYLNLMKSDSTIDISQVLSGQYHNFLVRMFDQMNSNYVLEYQSSNNLWIFILCFIAAIISSIAFLLIWIYNSVKIKGKVFGVLIWFLDIPHDYVKFSYQKCLYFNKNYIDSKKIAEKQIGIDNCQHYIEQYHNDKQFQEQSDEESQGQQKLRKILINRYRKQSITSKIQCKQFHRLWIFFFLNAFLVALLVLRGSISQQNSLVYKAQNIYARQLLWQQSLLMINKISQLKNIQTNNWKQFQQKQIADLDNKIKGYFDEILNIKNGSFYQVAKNLMERNDELTHYFSVLQFDSLCTNYSSQCKQILDNLLIGGYSLIKREILELKNSQNQLKQFYQAQKKYISSSVTQFIDNILNYHKNMITSMSSTLQIILYGYIIVALIMFLIVWNLYLRMINMQLNQTIRILNMIPMNLFPVARQQIRDFLKWLIRKCGQQGSEDYFYEQQQKIQSILTPQR